MAEREYPEEWLHEFDNDPIVSDALRDIFDDFAKDTGLNVGPEHWTNYDVFIDSDKNLVSAEITTDEGEIFALQQDIDPENWADYDWYWDVWDFIADYYDWIDEDTHYSEPS